LFLLGPGSTVEAIGRALGIDKTLLGIDAFVGGRQVGRDLDEAQILDLLRVHPKCKLILSPIGAQGFVLGRGNQQLSPAVIRAIGPDNLIIVATPAKLARTPVLRFDTGDAALDARLISLRYLPVLVGYRRLRMVKTAD
jgi:predicted polyphosphate/ATP-dependent NAD kinase